MAVDAFVAEICPIQPLKALTPIGFPNTLNLSFEVGNAGTTTVAGATLFKTFVIPAGVTIVVLDNGGATSGPANGSAFAGPSTITWDYAGLTLPAISAGGTVTLLSFNVSLLITSAVPSTITDIAFISAAGDANPGNNSALCNITLR